jgi:hypothetical protein
MNISYFNPAIFCMGAIHKLKNSEKFHTLYDGTGPVKSKCLFLQYSAETRFLQGPSKSLGVLPRNGEGNPEFPVQFSKKELCRFISCIFRLWLQEESLLHAALLSSSSKGA